MNPFRRIALALTVLAALVLVACSTPDRRIERNYSRFSSFPSEMRERIRAGQVAVGMTGEMVHMALGKPDDVFRRETEGGGHEVWAYRDKRPRFGIGVGVGGFSGHMGGGVSVGTTSGGTGEYRLQVVLREDRVTSIEQRSR